MNTKLKEVILEDGDEVKFTALTKNLGRAEFLFCPVYKRGLLKEMYIHPLQQENVKNYYKIIIEEKTVSFNIDSYVHKMDSPMFWWWSWCKDHKANCFRCYVPSNSNCFKVEKGSWLMITFDN